VTDEGRLWSFNHRKPFGMWKALTRNGSDPLNAPYPGRTGDKSNLKRLKAAGFARHNEQFALYKPRRAQGPER